MYKVNIAILTVLGFATVLCIYLWFRISGGRGNLISPNSTDDIFLSDKKSDYHFSDSTLKTRAEQVISVFENDKIEIQYGYIRNLDDGRGYTAGKAGFTTATGDFLLVVEEYTKLSPNNLLAKYLPRLKELSKEHGDDVSGLQGIVDAWEKSSEDLKFKLVQDNVTDNLYFNPAMKYAEKYNIRSNLGKVILYDTIIQHGDGRDNDSIRSIILEVNEDLGGGALEKDWLYKFLEIRKSILENPHNEDSTDVWSESTDRCDFFKEQLDLNNMDFKPPIIIDTDDHKAIIR